MTDPWSQRITFGPRYKFEKNMILRFRRVTRLVWSAGEGGGTGDGEEGKVG